MPHDLSFDLHRLVNRLDRAADGFLREAFGISYPRFLTLFHIGELGVPTQRAVAEAMGLSEPALSRMTGVLVEAGWLEVGRSPGSGNRRSLALTPSGKELVERAHDLLEARFGELVTHSGVPYAAYARHTRSLLRTLDQAPPSRQEAPR